MYYDQQGNEWKKFNTSDSAGVLFAKKLNIPIGIITGENTKIVAKRAEKLGITILYQGISNKRKIGLELCKKHNISIDEVAYIGDDIGDVNLLNIVGFSACPSNASEYIKSKVNFVTTLAGGKGAFREFVEHIIGEERLLNILEEYN